VHTRRGVQEYLVTANLPPPPPSFRAQWIVQQFLPFRYLAQLLVVRDPSRNESSMSMSVPSSWPSQYICLSILGLCTSQFYDWPKTPPFLSPPSIFFTQYRAMYGSTPPLPWVSGTIQYWLWQYRVKAHPPLPFSCTVDRAAVRLEPRKARLGQSARRREPPAQATALLNYALRPHVSVCLVCGSRPLCRSLPCCVGRPSVRGGPLWVGPLWVPPLLCSSFPRRQTSARGMAHVLALAPTVHARGFFDVAAPRRRDRPFAFVAHAHVLRARVHTHTFESALLQGVRT